MTDREVTHIRKALELLNGFVTVGPDGSEMIAAVQMTGDGPTRITGAIALQAARRELQELLLAMPATVMNPPPSPAGSWWRRALDWMVDAPAGFPP